MDKYKSYVPYPIETEADNSEESSEEEEGDPEAVQS
jgi:hypothetical protein